MDATGNWKKFYEDDTGDGLWDLKQTRSANKVNEITDINESAGPSWVTPVYDKAGNMTTIPKPADPTNSFVGTYDPWRRLMKLTEGANTVEENEYDGFGRRMVLKEYSSGVLDVTRHFYYSRAWQILEERTDSSTDPAIQNVWGIGYIDRLVLRDRDTTGNGVLDERLYALQDANWNVTSIADTTGTIVER